MIRYMPARWDSGLSCMTAAAQRDVRQPAVGREENVLEELYNYRTDKHGTQIVCRRQINVRGPFRLHNREGDTGISLGNLGRPTPDLHCSTRLLADGGQ